MNKYHKASLNQTIKTEEKNTKATPNDTIA